MSDKPTDLDSIAAAKAKLAQELRELELQEIELRKQQANQAFEKVIGLLNDFGGQFSAKQKADIAAFFGDEADKAKPRKRKASKQEVKPKYWLPHTQETWSGRGRPPRSFTAWVGSVSYREWKAKHPDEKFPKFPG